MLPKLKTGIRESIAKMTVKECWKCKKKFMDDEVIAISIRPNFDMKSDGTIHKYFGKAHNYYCMKCAKKHYPKLYDEMIIERI